MAYTTIDKPDEYFTTTVYTGNGSTLSISSLEFSPDFVWIKNRNIVSNHVLFDTVRGTTLSLESESTASESIRSGITSFDSNGFTLGSNGNSNANGNSHASWSWRGSDSSAVSNTAGSITSTVSANTTSGFSIVSWTTPASGNITVGHGLGVTPSMVIIKVTTQTGDWWVYHKGLGVNTTDYLSLNQTIAESSLTSMWGSTGMTSTLCGFGAGISAYSNNPMIAYCFAEKKGFSKFGSYTGNGSTDGTFVYTGFKPAMIIIKRTDSAEQWQISDNKRNTFNVVDKGLFPSGDFVESSSSSYYIDYTSNGFKLRNTATWFNASGGTYIYMAFAENPFVTSTSIPTTAR
jgi:hypothetical protein